MGAELKNQNDQSFECATLYYWCHQSLSVLPRGSVALLFPRRRGLNEICKPASAGRGPIIYDFSHKESNLRFIVPDTSSGADVGCTQMLEFHGVLRCSPTTEIDRLGAKK